MEFVKNGIRKKMNAIKNYRGLLEIIENIHKIFSVTCQDLYNPPVTRHALSVTKKTRRCM